MLIESGKTSGLLLILIFMISVGLRAQAEVDDTAFRIHGFGTLGVFHSDSDVLGWRHTLSLPGQFDQSWEVADNSYLGVQLDAQLASELAFRLQLIANDELSQNLDQLTEWAFFSWRPNFKYEVRLGRVGMPIYLLSEYRSVRFAQPWAHPPVEFYGQLSLHQLDGIDVTQFFHSESGLWRWRMGVGQTEFPVYVVTDNDFYDEKAYAVDFRPMLHTSLSFENMEWVFQWSFAAAHIDSEFEFVENMRGVYDVLQTLGLVDAVNISDQIVMQDRWIYYHSLGLSWDNRDWLVQSEISQIDSHTGIKNNTTGYISVGRRVGKWTLYGVFSGAQTNGGRTEAPIVPFSAGDVLQSLTQRILDGMRVNQETIALGARWDINAKLALKAQWDRSWVDQHSRLLMSIKPNAELAKDQTVDALSLQLDFVF